MARYLTPAKIGLLVLLQLYIDEAVPSDAIVPVLSFITAHATGHETTATATGTRTQSSRWARAERAANLVLGIRDFERLLAGFPFVMGMPGRKLWDRFLARLWALDSLHGLNEFFEALPRLLLKTKNTNEGEEEEAEEGGRGGIRMARNSPFGAFVRRAVVEHQKLRFHDAVALWRAFVRYRQPTAAYFGRRDAEFGELSFDKVLREGAEGGWSEESVAALTAVAYDDMLTGDRLGTVAVSTDDVEMLLDFQIEQMQKYGNRVPMETINQFQELLQASFMVPSLTHYLSFLSAWRAGDYPSAFDLLHRYFDYTMQYRDRLFYQYALMNLAVLQADFGCHRDAVTSMLETVTTARENRDMTCLNFALNWLFHFGRAHPRLVRSLESGSLLGTTGKDSLAYLRAKARESGMGALWSSVLLSEAKLGLVRGESVATAVEALVRSSHLIVSRNMTNMLGAQLALQAALWSRLGLAHLAATTCDVFLRCHARQHSVFDDELKVACRLALMRAEQGRYDDGLALLEGLDANSLRSWKPGQYWHKYRGIVKLTRDLRHGNLDGAQRILAQLLQSKADDLEPDMTFTIDLFHVDYLVRRGDLSAAFTKVTTMLAAITEDGNNDDGDDDKNDDDDDDEDEDESMGGKSDIAVLVRLLLLKTSLLDRAGRPQRGFSAAIRAANLARRARLVPQMWEAAGALANILVSRAEFAAAAMVLRAALPRALECDDQPALAARLYLSLADAEMGLAGRAASQSKTQEQAETKPQTQTQTQRRGSSRRAECLARALAAVQRAFDLYSRIEDCERLREATAKRAVIMRLTGETALAEDYAAAYVALRKNAEVLGLGMG